MQTSATTTSDRGRADIKLHEGEVLKAYRCPAGIWTIGVGLTSASGVVKVKPGMVITREESDRLLTEALRRNYEPRVAKAMPRAKQHEFDAGVSFDFNTGAIHRASWVKFWKILDWLEVERRLKQWTKGAGKVLPGLVRRREAEYEMMRFGRYKAGPNAPAAPAPVTEGLARWALQSSVEERQAAHAALRKLGFDPGNDPAAIRAGAVRAFQAKHDLTVDGIIGRATLSTLQRALDARGKAVPAMAVPAAAGGATVASPADTLPPGSDLVLVAVSIGYALWLAWRYRDQIAAAIQSPLPRAAAFLRSF